MAFTNEFLKIRELVGTEGIEFLFILRDYIFEDLKDFQITNEKVILKTTTEELIMEGNYSKLVERLNQIPETKIISASTMEELDYQLSKIDITKKTEKFMKKDMDEKYIEKIFDYSEEHLAKEFNKLNMEEYEYLIYIA